MKKYLIIAITALFALTACKDFLTEDPILSQSDKLTLSTYKGLNNIVAGAYSPLAAQSWYGADMITFHEMKTANGKKYLGSSKADSGRLNDQYSMAFSEGNTIGLWSYAYYVITAVDDVIDNLEGKDAPQEDLNNLHAECLFLRALAHFDLVRVYAQPYINADGADDGVPYVFHRDSEGKPARNTVKEVYEYIIADLLEAESLISADYVRTGINDQKAACSLEAIQALLSRAYLYSRDFAKSAEYAAKVINSNKFELWTAEDFADAKCFCYDAPQGGEIIFEVYGNKQNSYDPYREGLSPMTGNAGGYGDAGAAPDIVNAYSAGDVRGTLFRSLEDSGKTIWWTTKFTGKGVAQPDLTNTIVLRLSEMYLNIFEAVANGVSVTGINYNALKAEYCASRGISDFNFTRNDILLQRRLEFAWEGHYWFDLGRTGQAMTRGDDYIGADEGKEVPFPSYKWAMPIPHREYNVNPNLTHNPGWAQN
ncbi:MAG: RagB/SusD family nutrient uptake outer membrane protein [Candidatus Cryptobacteroides sp.]